MRCRRAVEPDEPHLYALPHRVGGVIFVFVLLMVVFITNVPLRGMWSLLVIVLAVALVVIFITLGWIETIITWPALLDVGINMAGYMTIAIFLFIIWLVALLAFNGRRTPFSCRASSRCATRSAAANSATTRTASPSRRQRSDFFRHYVLGMGSGDLIVRTAGAQSHHIDFPNVLFIHSKVQKIEQLIAQVGDRVEVTGRRAIQPCVPLEGSGRSLPTACIRAENRRAIFGILPSLYSFPPVYHYSDFIYPRPRPPTPRTTARPRSHG